MLTCRFENGDETSLRHVVVDGICLRGGKILLEKRSAGLVQGGKYALPGGYLKRDEITEQGILRELKEETGYDGKVVKLFRIVDDPKRPEDRQNVSFVFLVEVGEKTGEVDGEASEVAWFELDKLPAPEEFAFDHHAILQSYLENR